MEAEEEEAKEERFRVTMGRDGGEEEEREEERGEGCRKTAGVRISVTARSCRR